jgi:hypothetical protein
VAQSDYRQHIERCLVLLASKTPVESTVTNGCKAIALVALLLLTSAVKAQTVETVTVDFSANNGPVTYRASGFLHGMNSTAPSNADVVPMNGQLWRSDLNYSDDPNTYARVTGVGGTPMWILGDTWIQKYGLNNFPGSSDTYTIALWNSFVANIVNTAISNGQAFQWDIWNEPDISKFWTGTEAQYQTMWQNAVNTIRGISSSQIIVGPSTCCSPWGSWATNLMAFAQANRVLPNIVAVHELISPSELESDVAAIKSYLAANDPDITLVDVSEMVDETSDYYPGAAVQYLAAAEHAAVNQAAHSCWHSDCFDNSLDGLTNNGLIGNWYAYQAYGNITGQLVNVAPSANVDGIAGQDASLQRAYSVFGRNGTTATTKFVFNNISSSAPYLIVGGQIHVNAYLLTNDNGAGSSGPAQVIDTGYTVSSNSITVTFDNLGSDQVAIIQLTPGSGSGSGPGKPAPPFISSVVIH